MKRNGTSEMRLLQWIGKSGFDVGIIEYDCICYLETNKYIIEYLEFPLYSPILSLICEKFNTKELHLENDNVFHSEFYLVKQDAEFYLIPVFLCGSLLEEDDFDHYLKHFKKYTLKI